MSTSMLPSFYRSITNVLAPHTDHSVLVYTSMDHVTYDVHSPIYGYHSINDLSTVLREMETTFAIQVSNPYTKGAIDLAPYPQGEVDLGSGLSVRIVDDARDLIQYPHYQAVFIRADGSLVIWGDNEDTTLGFWYDIICRVQSPSGTAIPATTPVAGLPGNDGTIPANILSYLDDFASLFNFDDYLSTTSLELSAGSLGFTLPQRPRSPLSDDTNSSIMDSPSAADPEGTFPNSPSVYVGEEDEVGLNFPLSIGDRGVSPALSSYCSVPNFTPPVPEQANSSSSTRPHSVTETNAPGSFAHGTDQKATREDEEAGYHFPQPITSVNCSTSEAATGNADVVDLRNALNTRVLKRPHSAIAIGSAPTRLTIPLPDVQLEEDKRRKFLAIAPAPSPASASTPISTPISAPAPTFPSPSTPTSTPAASGKPQRRPGNRRRGGGKGAGKNTRKHPCEYCGKTFTRLQDQQRHIMTSCSASPHKSTVDCPECGAILSRMDAAQRHWRNHENPKCETPAWVSGRSRDE